MLASPPAATGGAATGGCTWRDPAARSDGPSIATVRERGSFGGSFAEAAGAFRVVHVARTIGPEPSARAPSEPLRAAARGGPSPQAEHLMSGDDAHALHLAGPLGQKEHSLDLPLVPGGWHRSFPQRACQAQELRPRRGVPLRGASGRGTPPRRSPQSGWRSPRLRSAAAGPRTKGQPRRRGRPSREPIPGEGGSCRCAADRARRRDRPRLRCQGVQAQQLCFPVQEVHETDYGLQHYVCPHNAGQEHLPRREGERYRPDVSAAPAPGACDADGVPPGRSPASVRWYRGAGQALPREPRLHAAHRLGHRSRHRW